MKDVVDLLLLNLLSKGMTPHDIACLIGDVLKTLVNCGEFTLNSMNQELECLGWENDILDHNSLEWIILLVENRGDYEVVRHAVH